MHLNELNCVKTGVGEENRIPREKWVNHMHPPHAKAAKGIKGLQFLVGRIIFPLDDGRLGELHLSGLGGETSGPSQHLNIRRKASLKYVWSILDAPETEGWNAEYCTEEYGSSNCVLGIKDQQNIDAETTRSTSKRRKGTKPQQNYFLPGSSGSGSDSGSGSAKSVDEYYSVPENWADKSFRLRVMHQGRSFFLITESGLTFEYLNAENMWFWLRHEHSTAMKGAIGNYNGSLFLVDEHRNLFMRERSSNELTWINCTAMRKGRQVIAGSPWDGMPGRAPKVAPDDALFFISKNGRLLQLTVSCEIKTSGYINF